MNSTMYYVAIVMEMKTSGPFFHQLVDTNQKSIRAKIDGIDGELITFRNVPIHVAGEVSIAAAPVDTTDKKLIRDKVADAIAEIKKHRGSYMSNKEAEDIFKHLRPIRDEAEK